MCPIPLSALKYSDKKADILSSNILAMQDSEASVKDVRSNTIISGNQIVGLRSNVVRKVDLIQLGVVREATSNAEYAKQINDHLQVITQQIGAIEEDARPTFAKEVSEFFAATIMAANAPYDINQKRICVDQANNISSIISNISNLCYEKKFQVYNGILEEIASLNENISSLYQVNKSLIALEKGSDTSSLEDQRDKIINNICSIVSIDTPVLGYQGSATITSGGFTLIDGSRIYTQISAPLMSQNDVNAGLPIPNIFMEHRKPNSFDIQQQGPVECTKLFSPVPSASGRIVGLYELYNNKLPLLVESLDILAANVAQKINAVHNSGSCTSGRENIIGSSTTYLSDLHKWSGSVTIGLIDANGRNLKTSPGQASYNIPPLKLNLEKLSGVIDGGAISTKMIIDEINSHFHFNNKTVVTIRQQPDDSKKHLMQDIQMAISGAKDGILKFDFSGFNNSDFNSDLEILDVTSPNGTYITGALPEKYSFKAGEKSRTFQTINLAKNTLTGSQNIDIKFRVTGSNGMFGEGTLRFNLDFDSILDPGTRITGTLIGGASDGNFNTTVIDTSSKISASLIRNDGSPIATGESGHLSITKNSSEFFGIVIQDEDSSTNVELDGFSSVSRGFGHFYGLNNLFTLQEKSGQYATSMAIRPDIYKDESLFSSGRLQRAAPQTQVKLVGSASASASVNFTAFGGAVDITTYHGATIAIDSKTYSLVNSNTTSTDQISIFGLTSEQEIIDQIISYLNEDRYINNLVEFSSNSPGTLLMTSKAAGSSGNIITYQFASSGSGIFNGAANTGLLNFANGADAMQNISIQTAALAMPRAYGKLYEDFANLEYNSDFITSATIKISSIGLSSYATNLLDRMLSFQQSAENNMNTKIATLKYFASDYQDKFGFDPSAHAIDITNLVFFKTTLAQTMSKIEEMRKIVMNTIAR